MVFQKTSMERANSLMESTQKTSSHPVLAFFGSRILSEITALFVACAACYHAEETLRHAIGGTGRIVTAISYNDSYSKDTASALGYNVKRVVQFVFGFFVFAIIGAIKPNVAYKIAKHGLQYSPIPEHPSTVRKQLENENNNLKTTIKTLTTTTEQLTKINKDQEIPAKQNKDLVDRLKKDVETLQNSKREKEEEIQKLRKEKEEEIQKWKKEKESEIQKLKKEKDLLQADLKKVQELTKVINKFKDLEEPERASSKTNEPDPIPLQQLPDTLNKCLSKLKDDIAEKDSRLNQVRATNEKMKKEAKESQERLKAQLNDLNKKTFDLDLATRKEKELQTQLDLLNKKNAELEATMSKKEKELQTQLDLLNKKSAELETTTNKKEKELQTQLDLLNKKNAELEITIREKEKDFQAQLKLSNTANVAAEENEKTSEMLQQQKEENQRLLEAIQSKDQHLEKMKSNEETLLQQQKEENQRLLEAIQSKDKQLEKMKSNEETLLQQQKEESQRLLETIQSKDKQLEKMKSNEEGIKKELQAFQKSYALTKARVEALKGNPEKKLEQLIAFLTQDYLKDFNLAGRQDIVDVFNGKSESTTADKLDLLLDYIVPYRYLFDLVNREDILAIIGPNPEVL